MTGLTSIQVKWISVFIIFNSVVIYSVSSEIEVSSPSLPGFVLPKDEKVTESNRKMSPDNDVYDIEREKLRLILDSEIVPNYRQLSLETYKFDSRTLTVRYLNEPESVNNEIPTIKNTDDFQIFDSDNPKYMNEWLVHMTGGEEVARKIVDDLNYKFIKNVFGFSDMYLVSHKMAHHNTKREAIDITGHINSHIKVLWAEQQVARKRDKRRSIAANREYSNMFNDKLWSHQWYLFDSRTRDDLPELDMKVIPVWNSGITGKGIRILIVDDGIEWTHDDIKDSYDPRISYDLNDDDTDPSPRMNSVVTNSHGTKCAGEIVMKPNNFKCGVGIAYGAIIGGIRALDGDVTDIIEGSSLARNLNDIDIISCSWGPSDDGTTVEGPGKLTQLALKLGVTKGRKGKGIIYVWASGNGGSNNDNCNCDGYSSSIYTISIGSASESGEAPWYGEHCSSTIAAAYSSGGYSDQKISTTDLGNTCTGDFTGTSAATPLAAGVIALALEANSNLTWRDVQHAVIMTSDWQALSHDLGWHINKRGLHFNSKLGFGLINAEKLISTVNRWKAIPEKIVVTIEAELKSGTTIDSRSLTIVKITPNFSSKEEHIVFLEHVELIVNLQHPQRGVLRITLVSPSGTSTDVLTPRLKDISKNGFDKWSFMSVHTWGEDPVGNWEVIIEDTSAFDEFGTLKGLSLMLHGTTVVPEMYENLH